MAVLFCISVSLFVFFAVCYIFMNVRKMEIVGRVHGAVEKRKSRNFVIPVIMYNADRVGYVLSCVKCKGFKVLIEKTGAILNFLGEKYEKINLYQFFALRLFAMISGMLFAVIFISANVFVVLLLGGIFFFLPLLKIKEEAKKRKELIAKQLPDVADLLSVMLDTGLDFYGASEKVIQILQGPLVVELKNALAKISFGYDKKTALTEIVQRTGVEQLVFCQDGKYGS